MMTTHHPSSPMSPTMATLTSLNIDPPTSTELETQDVAVAEQKDEGVDEEFPLAQEDLIENTNNDNNSLSLSSTSDQDGVLVEQSSRSDNNSNNNSNASFLGAIANLCSATLGEGVLSLPFALYQAGWVFGFLLLFLAAWSSIISIRFIVEASSHFQIYTYEGLVEYVLGPTAKRLTEFCLVIFCGGCAVAYVIAVGDILNPIAPLLDRKYVIIGVWCTAMLPLSLLRRMESLQWASSVGVASIGTLMAAVLVHYWGDPTAPSIEEDLSQLLWPASSSSSEQHNNNSAIVSVLRACPIFLFAFSCQVNVCAIFDELPTPPFSSQDDKKNLMHNVTTSSVGLCGVLYAAIASTAVLDFASHVQPNVLVNYCPVGIMRVAFGCMALAVVMAFPLNVFPARVALEGIFWKSETDQQDNREQTNQSVSLREPLLAPQHDGSTVDESYRFDFAPVDEPFDTSIGLSMENDVNGPNEEEIVFESNADEEVTTNISTAANHETKLQKLRHFVLSIAIAGSALALALIIPDISVVFGLLGGTTSSILGFILPGLLGKSLPGMERSIQAWMLIIGGTIVGILTTAVTIWTTISTASSSSTAGNIPDACDTGTIAPTTSPTYAATT